MEEITILPAPPSEMIKEWPVIEPMLDKAMPVMLRRYEPIDILAICIAGQAQGWLVRDADKVIAVMITKIDHYPRRRGLSLFALGGDPHRGVDWFGIAKPIMREHAKQMGCDHWECAGRKGWEKILELEPRSMFYVEDLTNGGAML
jgi:hypothetical protein